jgi:hypothetical protein
MKDLRANTNSYQQSLSCLFGGFRADYPDIINNCKFQLHDAMISKFCYPMGINKLTFTSQSVSQMMPNEVNSMITLSFRTAGANEFGTVCKRKKASYPALNVFTTE